MATELSVKPVFDIMHEYAMSSSSSQEIYLKLNNHHGDQFGKCKITGESQLQLAKIRIVTCQEHQELIGKVTCAIWSKQRGLKVQHAEEGKTTLNGLAMLLVDTEELPLYIQRQMPGSFLHK